MRKRAKVGIITGCAAIAACIAVGVTPHTVTIQASVPHGQEQYFKGHDSTLKVSLFDSLMGNAKIKSQDVNHYTLIGYRKIVGTAGLQGNQLTYILGKTTIEASYQPVSYHITFKDGQNSQQISRTYGSGLVFTDSKDFDKQHPYEDFTGWKDKDGKIITKLPPKYDKDLTLTAAWNPKSYTITYDLDQGNAENPPQYVYGTGISSLHPASKNGYAFTGWYKDKTHTERVASIPADAHENLILYAAYRENPKPVQPQNVQKQTPRQQHQQTQNNSGNTDHKLQRASKQNVSQASNGSRYNWSAYSHGEQADIDKGQLVQYNRFDNYYAAHAYTSYGKGIASLKPGDKVTVNGKTVVIDGETYTPNTDKTMDEVFARIPGGESTPAFQTCVDTAGNAVIKYGHYE